MISIVTPTLNSGKYLEATIESIKKLTIPYEHIIVDGGSIDNTLDIISRYDHIILQKQYLPDGMYGAITQGFNTAQYEILAYVNSDDCIIPENYEYAVKILYEKFNFNFLYGDTIFKNEIVDKEFYHKSNRFGKYFLKLGIMPFSQPSTLFRKGLYDKIRFNYSEYKVISDLEMFHRMSLTSCFNYIYFPKPISKFRIHGNSYGDKNSDIARFELLKFSRINIFNRFLFFITKFI